MKHLDVRYHWIRERVENGEIAVTQITTSDNIADILTKALPEPTFTKLRGYMGIVEVIGK